MLIGLRSRPLHLAQRFFFISFSFPLSFLCWAMRGDSVGRTPDLRRLQSELCRWE